MDHVDARLRTLTFPWGSPLPTVLVTCPRCNVPRPERQWHHGVTCQCGVCRSSYQRDYYRRNERYRAHKVDYQRGYRAILRGEAVPIRRAANAQQPWLFGEEWVA